MHLGPDPQVYALTLNLERWEALDHTSGISVGVGNLQLGERRVKISPTSSEATAIHITVGLSKPLSERLTEIVRSLFPKAKVRLDPYAAGEGNHRNVPEPTDSLTCVSENTKASDTEDLRIRAEMIPNLVERKQPVNVLANLEVRVKLTIFDASWRTVEVLDVVDMAEVDGFTFNAVGPWEDIGEEALLNVSDKLVEAIRNSQRLGSCLKRLAEPRSLPAGLVTTAHFDDTTSLLPNGLLDAGEEAHLMIHVENHGPGPAYNVVVKASSDHPEVTVSGDSNLGELAPGGEKDVVLPVASRLDLTTGSAKLRVETTERRGYGARPLLVELATSQLLLPKLEIVDVTLNDHSDRAKGNGDGLPGNGETIEAVVRVRNAGPGEAAAVAVTMTSPKVAAEILDSKVILPTIPAARLGVGKILFRLPYTLEVSELPLSFKVVEARGVQVGSAVRDQTWKVSIRHPDLKLAYDFYDGQLMGSTGNSNKEVNNGEKIVVVVTPGNSGDLPAQGVKIAVKSDDGKLFPQPPLLEVGDLPVQAKGSPKSFSFDMPRNYGIDGPEGYLRFTMTVSQQDFGSSQVPVELRFRPLRPELSVEMPPPPALARGTSGELILRLRNKGTLPAEDVVMEVASETSGFDLLDDRGHPVPSLKIKYDVLAPQTEAPESSIGVRVRQTAAVDTAQLRLTVSQKDLPPLIRDAKLSIAKEPVEVSHQIPTIQEKVIVPTPFSPPAISFLSNASDEFLTEESIRLRFEVQSTVALNNVRLTQNQKELPLEERYRRPVRESDAPFEVVQYDLPVQLVVGENVFEVVAVSPQGKNSRSLKLTYHGKLGRLWVVAVGISKYQDPSIDQLRYADTDAKAIYDYFRYTFKLQEDQGFLLLNERATLREIKSTLGALITRANDPRDTIVLYFAGHGSREHVTGDLDSDKLNKYLLPYDASNTDPFGTALEMDDLTSIIKRLIPRRVVILLDSCFSGTAGVIEGKFLDPLTQDIGRVLITASGPEEKAEESEPCHHGVFTCYLLEWLRSAANVGNDGFIDLHKAYTSVSGKVVLETKNRQHPKLKPEGNDPILVGLGAIHHQP